MAQPNTELERVTAFLEPSQRLQTQVTGRIFRTVECNDHPRFFLQGMQPRELRLAAGVCGSLTFASAFLSTASAQIRRCPSSLPSPATDLVAQTRTELAAQVFVGSSSARMASPADCIITLPDGYGCPPTLVAIDDVPFQVWSPRRPPNRSTAERNWFQGIETKRNRP